MIEQAIGLIIMLFCILYFLGLIISTIIWIVSGISNLIKKLIL